ncbi:hypothetical protein VTJ04DRAFT_3910 [Mycothermus thermophilus]|uniref:uncharacterized protein n=1 Tax=Humicola insolens TaxID=85995 RepID=UPI00374321E3
MRPAVWRGEPRPDTESCKNTTPFKLVASSYIALLNGPDATNTCMGVTCLGAELFKCLSPLRYPDYS